MPHSADVSDALFRRAVVLEFNNMFSPSDASHDVNLIDMLKAEGAITLISHAVLIVIGFTHKQSCSPKVQTRQTSGRHKVSHLWPLNSLNRQN